MNTLIVVVALLLICLGYAIGSVCTANKWEANILRRIGDWRSKAGSFHAQAKEFEQERRLAEADQSTLKSTVLMQCVQDLYNDYEKEPRRII